MSHESEITRNFPKSGFEIRRRYLAYRSNRRSFDGDTILSFFLEINSQLIYPHRVFTGFREDYGFIFPRKARIFGISCVFF